MPRAIAKKTYISFMKKYKLKLMNKQTNSYVYKTMKEMSKEIYKYEMKHINLLKEGLYIVD